MYLGSVISFAGGILAGFGYANIIMDWVMMNNPNGQALLAFGVIVFVIGIICVYFAKPQKAAQ